MTRGYNAKQGNETAKRWAIALWTMALSMGGYLINQSYCDKTKTVKEPAKIEERISQPGVTKQSAIVNQVQNKSSGLENKVLEAEKKAKSERPAEIRKAEALAQYSKPYNAGIVVCSNQNYLYAQLNLAELKKNYPNAFIQEIKDKKTTYYRTIIGSTSENIEPLMAELKAKNLFGLAEQYFKIGAKDIKSIVKRSKESPAKVAKEVKKMENDFRVYLQKRNRQEFITLMIPYIDQTHKLYTGENLSWNRMNTIAGSLYDAAHEFNVPLMDWTALIGHESKFTNQRLDTWSKDNYSEGLGSMRKDTQKDVLEGMKKAGVKRLPAQLPDSILLYPELQLRMSSSYYSECLKKSGWDGKSIIIPESIIKAAESRYNKGLYSTDPNKKYEGKIEEEKEKLKGKLSSNSQ
jgi:hypothetical protein